MHKRLLALSLLLTVSCMNAMETREDKKEEPEKVSLFEEITRGMDADIDFEMFCENFKSQLNDGTIDPNETLESGFTGLDTLAELYLFHHDMAKPGRLFVDSESFKRFLPLYELLSQSEGLKGDAKHDCYASYMIRCFKYLQIESSCSKHNQFIKEIKTNHPNCPDYQLNMITHDNLLEMLSCGVNTSLGEGYNCELKNEYLRKLEVLNKKFDDIKEAKEMREKKTEAKWVMLCLKDKGYSNDFILPIASMIVTGHADSIKTAVDTDQ